MSTVPEYDHQSDDLILIIADVSKSPHKRNDAARVLYHRHDKWVRGEIKRRVFDHNDVLDIAQNVWMLVLEPGHLAKVYKHRNGKFRAYLRNVIKWSIMKHIDMLPKSADKGVESIVAYREIPDDDVDQLLTEWFMVEAIEQVIKPSLRDISVKRRNVYVANEYRAMFTDAPSVDEVALINGLTGVEAQKILDDANGLQVDQCTDQQVSVYLPMRYDSLVDESEILKSSSRYLSSVMGITDSQYRQRLYKARTMLRDIVKQWCVKYVGDCDGQ